MRYTISIGIALAVLLLSYGALSRLSIISQDSLGIAESLAEGTDSAIRSFHSLTARYLNGLEQIEKNAFSIDVVEVNGTYRVSKERVLEAADLIHPVPIQDAELERRRLAMEQLPWISQANLSLRLSPARLVITVKEEEPWVVAEYKGHSWLISQKGVLLQTLDSISDSDLVLEASELPRITGLDATENGRSFLRSSNARFEYGLQLIEFLDLAGGIPFEVEEYSLLLDGALRVSAKDFNSTPTVLFQFATLDDAKDSISKLNAVLQDLKEREEKARSIDLRFRNQAIVR